MDDAAHLTSSDRPLPSRRVFIKGALIAGVAATLPGCGQAGGLSRALPGPIWPDDVPDDHLLAGGTHPQPAVHAGGTLPRSSWARAGGSPGLMKRMLPVSWVTVHHCAGPVFADVDTASTIERLESIRRYHRETLGWGDIGYHFAIDRAGRIWECRPLGWQGAHVSGCNEGNIGVVALGNFDDQEPSTAQVESLTRHVRQLMQRYRVPPARLRTHQEWASTACPGRSLQRYMDDARRGGRFA